MAEAKPKAVTKTTTKQAVQDPSRKRPYMKQQDVPSASLDEALRLPQAIMNHYAGKPTSPLFIAKALNVDPKGSQIRVLSGAAIAFGLIEGGAQAASISLTELARRILRPREESMELSAKREAVLAPRIFGEFLRTYDGHPFPRPDIAKNVLEEMGVPREKTEEVLERIETSAHCVGFLQEIKDKRYVALQETASGVVAKTEVLKAPNPAKSQDDSVEALPPIAFTPPSSSMPAKAGGTTLATAIVDDQRRRRVFITHGKNRELVDPIRKLLEYGELDPVISVDRQSVSKPVPEKVMDDMRSCGAAIIHIDIDRVIVDRDMQEHVLLNPNVLIEIGAAMAFYGRRFILLVGDGVKLPSNLQGLYEVRYSGETLDANATIKLLEAIRDIKNYSLPTQTRSAEDLP